MRRIGRIATLAAELGARFTRERVDVDPLAWMSAPRRLFDGRPAIMAVQNAEHFRRAMLLHGLSLGLDADPDDIDDLIGHAEDDADLVVPSSSRSAEGGGQGVPGLFTAVVVDVGERGSLFVFHARLASSRTEFETGLRLRLGSRLADGAKVEEGYDPSEPIAAALVSAALEDLLLQVVGDPRSPLAAGLDVLIEQRFAD